MLESQFWKPGHQGSGMLSSSPAMSRRLTVQSSIFPGRCSLRAPVFPAVTRCLCGVLGSWLPSEVSQSQQSVLQFVHHLQLLVQQGTVIQLLYMGTVLQTIRSEPDNMGFKVELHSQAVLGGGMPPTSVQSGESGRSVLICAMCYVL